MASLLDDPRWDTIKTRDKTDVASFVYAVTTTGIYCRPGCPSRLPRRETIRFFECASDAERAGFRPCLRCRPHDEPAEKRQAEAIAKACALIEAAEERPDFDAIARASGMSRHHFHRMFKQAVGLTPGAYCRALRQRRALDGLSVGRTVTEAIHAAGYGSTSRFYEGFAPALGLDPLAFTKGGAGETILFAVGECSLGSIVVAASARGICAIELGDAPDPLVAALQDRFPNAELKGAEAGFERIVAEAVALVEEPARAFSLPLDIRGTAFQAKVWQVLRTIPPGETVSYAELAVKAGAPSAVRAVASACAANRIAIAIPCHRVVRTDGALSGYRWGVERKATLLKREKGT